MSWTYPNQNTCQNKHMVFSMLIVKDHQLWRRRLVPSTARFSTCCRVMKLSPGWGRWTPSCKQAASRLRALVCMSPCCGFWSSDTTANVQSVSVCQNILVFPSTKRWNHQKMKDWESSAWWEKCQTRWAAQPADAPLIIVRNRWTHLQHSHSSGTYDAPIFKIPGSPRYLVNKVASN